MQILFGGTIYRCHEKDSNCQMCHFQMPFSTIIEVSIALENSKCPLLPSVRLTNVHKGREEQAHSSRMLTPKHTWSPLHVNSDWCVGGQPGKETLWSSTRMPFCPRPWHVHPNASSIWSMQGMKIGQEHPTPILLDVTWGVLPRKRRIFWPLESVD